jgi:hypothetical protein
MPTITLGALRTCVCSSPQVLHFLHEFYEMGAFILNTVSWTLSRTLRLSLSLTFTLNHTLKRWAPCS